MLRPLSFGSKEKSMDTFKSDIGTLSDDNVSLTESVTEVQSSIADAPAKIPLTGRTIQERLREVRKIFSFSQLFCPKWI